MSKIEIPTSNQFTGNQDPVRQNYDSDLLHDNEIVDVEGSEEFVLERTKYRFLGYTGENFEFIEKLKIPNKQVGIAWLEQLFEEYGLSTSDDFYNSIVYENLLSECQAIIDKIAKESAKEELSNLTFEGLLPKFSFNDRKVVAYLSTKCPRPLKESHSFDIREICKDPAAMASKSLGESLVNYYGDSARIAISRYLIVLEPIN